MKRLLLKDILTSNVTTTSPNYKVVDALDRMHHERISAIIITDDNVPIGIFTERDAVKMTNHGYDPTHVAMRKVMSTPVLSVSEQMEYREAYFLIAEKGYRHLVVVDDEGKLSGIVSEGDFMRNLGMEFLLRIKEVGALMTHNPTTLTKDASVKDAVELMSEKQLSCIVVTENNKPTGMLTERDIVRLQSEVGNIANMSISDVMTHPVTSVETTMPLTDAMKLMDQNHFRRVSVVDAAGELVGLLTRHDIVKQLYNRHVELLEESLHQNKIKLESVTKELEKEKGLHELESRLSESQRLANIGSWELDKVSNELWWSEETYRIFEMDPNKFEASYEAFLNLIHPEDRPFVNTSYTDSVNKNEPYNIVHRLRFSDGRIKYVNERGTTYYDEGGTPLRSVGTVQDITEKYHKDEEIERYHAMLMALVEGSTDSIFVKNHAGVYIVGNEALATLLHKPLADVIGADDYALFPLDLAKQFQEDDQRVMESKQVETYEEPVASDGKILPYQTTKGPLIINGRVEGVFGIARDISSIKENEERLTSYLQHFLTAFRRMTWRVLLPTVTLHTMRF